MAWPKDLPIQEREARKLEQFVQRSHRELRGTEILVYILNKGFMETEWTIAKVYKVSQRGRVQEVVNYPASPRPYERALGR